MPTFIFPINLMFVLSTNVPGSRVDVFPVIPTPALIHPPLGSNPDTKGPQDRIPHFSPTIPSRFPLKTWIHGLFSINFCKFQVRSGDVTPCSGLFLAHVTGWNALSQRMRCIFKQDAIMIGAVGEWVFASTRFVLFLAAFAWELTGKCKVLYMKRLRLCVA